MGDSVDNQNFDPPTTPWQMYQTIGKMAGDIRAIKQTMDETVTPKLKEHEDDINKLKSRFVYALTMIGSAIGAVAYLFLNGRGVG